MPDEEGEEVGSSVGQSLLSFYSILKSVYFPERFSNSDVLGPGGGRCSSGGRQHAVGKTGPGQADSGLCWKAFSVKNSVLSEQRSLGCSF